MTAVPAAVNVDPAVTPPVVSVAPAAAAPEVSVAAAVVAAVVWIVAAVVAAVVSCAVSPMPPNQLRTLLAMDFAHSPVMLS